MTTAPNAPVQHRLGALAWTSVILGIVGLVGSPVILFNNLTAIAAGVGLFLAIVALFGTRKILATLGLALCVGAIVATVFAQQAAVEELERDLDQIEQDFQRDMARLTEAPHER